MEIGKSLKNIFLILIFAWHSNSVFSQYNDVQTPLGTVRGTQVRFNHRMVNQYLGVPYAKPPVGDLRFKKPEPVEPFFGTYIANKMPPACIQYTEVPFPWYDFEDGKSEDCLYLNIWVPGRYPRNLPVLFWIHGGGFTFGSSRKRIYEGQALAAEGHVVVVTINYRLGLFGFLTSGTEEAPGNYGMYDILEAMKWVHKDIAAFGGNPNQVTLVGESAGSMLVGLLCVSPLTKGLFHRVIMQSGSSAYTLADNSVYDNVATSQKLAEAVGCTDESNRICDDPESVISCLKEKDAKELVRTLNSLDPLSAVSFFPMYGDEILPRNARQELIDDNFHDVDLLIGNTLDEGPFLITTAHPDVFGFFGGKYPNINKTYGEKLLSGDYGFPDSKAVVEHYLGSALPDVFGFFSGKHSRVNKNYGQKLLSGNYGFPDSKAVVEHYLGSVDEDDYDLIRHQVYTAVGDHWLLCPTVFFAESYSRAGNDVHFYYFTHRPSTTPWAKWAGSAHYEEVQFVFGLPLQEPGNYTPAEVLLSRRMIGIWTNFVRSGSTGVLNWPSYSREKPVYMKLNTEHKPKFGQGPHKDNCDFFRSFYGFQ